MPSSTNRHLHVLVDTIRNVDPESILDCGVGFGKVGFLCREYLDVYKGRVYPDEWKVNICGVEIHGRYITEYSWLSEIYDAIFMENMYDCLKEFADKKIHYDLVVACDVLEHLEKSKAIECILNMKKVANKGIIISIPLGARWLNNKVVGQNKYEKHQSWWLLEDFQPLLGKFSRFIWHEPKGKGTLIYWKKEA